MSEYNDSDVSREKRAMLPDSFGESCPNCGEPFDAGSSGILYPENVGTDVRSWVRLCTGPIPDGDWFAVPVIERDMPFAYVHKDEHLDE